MPCRGRRLSSVSLLVVWSLLLGAVGDAVAAPPNPPPRPPAGPPAKPVVLPPEGAEVPGARASWPTMGDAAQAELGPAPLSLDGSPVPVTSSVSLPKFPPPAAGLGPAPRNLHAKPSVPDGRFDVAVERVGVGPVWSRRLSEVTPVSVVAPTAARAREMAGERRRTPSAVAVNVIGSQRASEIGLFGMAVTLEDASPAAEVVAGDTAVVTVEFDYDDFRYAYGGDFAGRLQVVRLPACSLTTPDEPGCLVPEVVGSFVNDIERGVLTAGVGCGLGSTFGRG